MKYPDCHAEVLDALVALGSPSFGRHMARDRGSAMKYVGIRVPALRRRVREGFSFLDREPEAVLDIWDDLWMHSQWGDVLFAAEEYYRPLVRRRVLPMYWPVMRRWIARVDNWAHSDVLSWTYSACSRRIPIRSCPNFGGGTPTRTFGESACRSCP